MAALLGVALCGAARGQIADHVIVVVVDGLRASEGFDHPDRTNVAPLVDALLPDGALLTDVECRDQTVTLTAHQVLVSGNYADYRNFPVRGERDGMGPRTPTVFDAYRLHTGAPETATWVIGNTPLLHDSSYSLMPGYDHLGAARRLDYTGTQPDSWSWDQVYDALASHEVALMLVNLHEVDRWGHAGVFEMYTQRAYEAFEDVVALWDWLQDDPVYRDRTALLVTTDHGRHRDAVATGWIDHGCECRGCRQTFLFAIGPGVRAGVETAEPVSQRDVAPTVAHLLGVPLPYARGRVLDEILTEGAQAAQVHGGKHRPRLAAADGLLLRASEWHVPDELDAGGAHEVLMEASADHGASWSRVVFPAAGVARSRPVAWTDGEVQLLGWAEVPVAGEGWSLHLMRKGPEGGPWTEVHSEAIHGPGTGAFDLSLAVSPDGVMVLVENNPTALGLRFWTSKDRGGTWSGAVQTPHVPRYFKRDLRQVHVGETWLLAASAHVTDLTTDDERADNTEIYVLRSADGGANWEAERDLSRDDAPSIQPAMAATADGTVHVVWADRRGGTFQLFHAASDDEGETWSAPRQLTDAALGAWEPALAASGDGLVVAWSQFDEVDEATVWVAPLQDGALGTARPYGHAGAVARTPDLVPVGECHAFLAWSESDLDSPWALGSALVASATVPAAAASGSIEPAAIPAREVSERFVVEVDLSIADGDVGAAEIVVAAPDGLALGGEIEAWVDGAPATGVVVEHGGPVLRYALDPAVAHDRARLTLAFDATIVAPSLPAVARLEVTLGAAAAPCDTPVSGTFEVHVPDAAAALRAQQEQGCECRVAAGRRGGLAVLLVLGAALALRRAAR